MITAPGRFESGELESGRIQPSRSWSQRRLLGMIDFYQRVREGRPSPCRFHPSCSSYAKESLAVHGAGRGTWLAVRRLLRCRPFGPSGFDPVPPARVGSRFDEPSGHGSRTVAPQTVRHHTIAVPIVVQKG
jgi:hypothetical protein